MNANVQIGWLQEAFFLYCTEKGVTEDRQIIEWNLYWKQVCRVKDREKHRQRRKS